MAASFAIFLQALLPLSFMTGVNADAARAASTDLPGWSMESLCTTLHGATGADRAPAPAGQVPGSHPVCPLCLGLHIMDAYVPSLIAVAVPGIHRPAVVARDVSLGRLDDRRSASRARAPPVLA
jgi:hypothetical protein